MHGGRTDGDGEPIRVRRVGSGDGFILQRGRVLPHAFQTLPMFFQLFFRRGGRGECVVARGHSQGHSAFVPARPLRPVTTLSLPCLGLALPLLRGVRARPSQSRQTGHGHSRRHARVSSEGVRRDCGARLERAPAPRVYLRHVQRRVTVRADPVTVRADPARRPGSTLHLGHNPPRSGHATQSLLPLVQLSRVVGCRFIKPRDRLGARRERAELLRRRPAAGTAPPEHATQRPVRIARAQRAFADESNHAVKRFTVEITAHHQPSLLTRTLALDPPAPHALRVP
mmetsp:Transcript_6575/g.29685  ORF Transcript_6575/g.29685 Transcript_6575/m.29685 type:complete len:284 (-) Transcript_6575:6162-7013(-)